MCSRKIDRTERMSLAIAGYCFAHRGSIRFDSIFAIGSFGSHSISCALALNNSFLKLNATWKRRRSFTKFKHTQLSAYYYNVLYYLFSSVHFDWLLH